MNTGLWCAARPDMLYADALKNEKEILCQQMCIVCYNYVKKMLMICKIFLDDFTRNWEGN